MSNLRPLILAPGFRPRRYQRGGGVKIVSDLIRGMSIRAEKAHLDAGPPSSVDKLQRWKEIPDIVHIRLEIVGNGRLQRTLDPYDVIIAL